MLLLLACSDYDVTKNGEPPDFDSGGGSPFQPDSTEDSEPIVTVDTAPPPECADQAFLGEALTLDDDCATAPTVGTFTPVVEWSADTFATEPTSDNVMSTPIVISLTDDDGDGDADQDDVPDIVFVTYVGTGYSSEGVLRAVSGDDGHSLWDATDGNVGGCAGLAAADLDDDGFPEVIASTVSGELAAFAADGSHLWTSEPWANGGYGTFAQPAIADMDDDGEPEIVAGSSIYDADGNKIAAGGSYSGNGNGYSATAFPADLDGDGVMELIAGETVYELDGSERWSTGAADGSPAIADFDLDGTPEIVTATGGKVRLLGADGSVWWEAKAGMSTAGPPTIADYDGDGYPEVGVATNSTYTVIDTDGAILWQNPTTDASSGVTGSAVFDFEGDGLAEVVYADEITVWGSTTSARRSAARGG